MYQNISQNHEALSSNKFIHLYKQSLVLNMMLTQRSQDNLAANNWNVCQYAILLMMLAQVSDMIPGELVHCIAGAHIYERHVPIVKDLIKRIVPRTESLFES